MDQAKEKLSNIASTASSTVGTLGGLAQHKAQETIHEKMSSYYQNQAISDSLPLHDRKEAAKNALEHFTEAKAHSQAREELANEPVVQNISAAASKISDTIDTAKEKAAAAGEGASALGKVAIHSALEKKEHMQASYYQNKAVAEKGTAAQRKSAAKEALEHEFAAREHFEQKEQAKAAASGITEFPNRVKEKVAGTASSAKETLGAVSTATCEAALEAKEKFLSEWNKRGATAESVTPHQRKESAKAALEHWVAAKEHEKAREQAAHQAGLDVAASKAQSAAQVAKSAASTAASYIASGASAASQRVAPVVAPMRDRVASYLPTRPAGTTNAQWAWTSFLHYIWVFGVFMGQVLRNMPSTLYRAGVTAYNTARGAAPVVAHRVAGTKEELQAEYFRRRAIDSGLDEHSRHQAAKSALEHQFAAKSHNADMRRALELSNLPAAREAFDKTLQDASAAVTPALHQAREQLAQARETAYTALLAAQERLKAGVSVAQEKLGQGAKLAQEKLEQGVDVAQEKLGQGVTVAEEKIGQTREYLGEKIDAAKAQASATVGSVKATAHGIQAEYYKQQASSDLPAAERVEAAKKALAHDASAKTATA